MTEVAKYEAQAPIGGNPAHVRLGVNQVALVANYFAESGLFKISQRGGAPRSMTPQECFAIVMAGQSLGIGPMPSMMSFHIIEGRPEMSANLQAHFLKASEKYDYRMHFVHLEDGTVDACHIDVIDTRTGEVIGESHFTKAMAQKAGLVRAGGNWDKFAESMLFARAISNAVAWHAPDAVPMRIYSDGEISGPKPDTGVQAVQGEGPPSEAKVSAMVERAVAEAEEPEEEIEDAEIVEPEPNVGADPDAEPANHVTMSPETVAAGLEANAKILDDEIPDRFSPAAVETRLRADLPNLGDDDKVIVKSTVEAAGLPWGYPSIVQLIVAAGYTDVHSWLRGLQTAVAGAPAPEEGESRPAGVTGRQTGSQTVATVSDAQVRLFNAKCSEAVLTEAERKLFLKKFAQVESSRAIAKADFDDILAALKDIAEGGPETKTAFLGD